MTGSSGSRGPLAASGGGGLTINQIVSGLPAVYEWNPDDNQWASIIIGPDGRAIYNNYQVATTNAIRAITSHSTGKYYYEFIIGAVASPYPGIGVGTSASPLTNYVGSDTTSYGYFADGNARHNALNSAGASLAAGDIVGVAVDFTGATGSIKWYKNNVQQTTASYTSLTLGTMYPMGSLNTVNLNWGRLRLKTGEQTYSPPAGYVSWE